MESIWAEINRDPESDARSHLTARKYADWIEGKLRQIPGYERRAPLEQNYWVLSGWGDRADYKRRSLIAIISTDAWD